VQKNYKVTNDSSLKTGFFVHKADCTICVFMPSHKGLFFSDVKSDPTHIMIDTVDTIKNKYTVKAYSDVCKA